MNRYSHNRNGLHDRYNSRYNTYNGANAPPLMQQPEYEAPPPYTARDNLHYEMGFESQLRCPRDLEYLSQIDQLIVKQKIEILEVLTGFETNNQYDVQNTVGQNVFLAQEDTDPVTRNCMSPSRPFEMKILNNNKKEVIHLHRPLKCSNCCFPCCLQQLQVSNPPGNAIGYVLQKWSIFSPVFEVCDAYKNPLLLIQGPMIKWNAGGDVEFKILTMDGTTEVGRITKQWGGVLKEMFTDADTFSITFPNDLDVMVKATLLGACLLIDFMYYEEVSTHKRRRAPNDPCRSKYNNSSMFKNFRWWTGEM